MQARTSGIVTNAHRINRGEMPDLRTAREGDFFMIEENDPSKIVKLITDLCVDRLPKHYKVRLEGVKGGEKDGVTSQDDLQGGESLHSILYLLWTSSMGSSGVADQRHPGAVSRQEGRGGHAVPQLAAAEGAQPFQPLHQVHIPPPAHAYM
jgi:hypothetical protein